MMRHASAETLARFRSGSLRRGATRRVRAHLGTCARCTATYDALGEIPALLSAAQPPPIPAHLAARIETALATESAHRSAGSPSVRPARSGRAPARRGQPARPLHAARGRGRLPVPALRALAAAAAAVVIGGGTYAAVQFGGPTGTAGGSAGSAPQSAGAGAQGTSGGPMRSGAKAPAALGPFVRYQAGGHAVAIRPVQSATNYQPDRLAAQVTATLEHAGRERVSPEVSLPHADHRLGSSQLTQLSGCLSRVAGGQPIRLVDLAQFRGSAATIIVTKATSSRAAQVWVVGPGCSRSAGDVLEHRQLPG